MEPLKTERTLSGHRGKTLGLNWMPQNVLRSEENKHINFGNLLGSFCGTSLEGVGSTYQKNTLVTTKRKRMVGSLASAKMAVKMFTQAKSGNCHIANSDVQQSRCPDCVFLEIEDLWRWLVSFWLPSTKGALGETPWYPKPGIDMVYPEPY